jgi:hypothetical protein
VARVAAALGLPLREVAERARRAAHEAGARAAVPGSAPATG